MGTTYAKVNFSMSMYIAFSACGVFQLPAHAQRTQGLGSGVILKLADLPHMMVRRTNPRPFDARVSPTRSGLAFLSSQAR
ncbi:hypothetical protein GK0296 [Geobacillus kaustophilus HTA426]|uniref:Lipoprotein n=1 Tax=Geobacillus kaustophilus (strain HTA426) TaxID=235909 RepID=Q5L399_GEOKA|nr:hypothetical protein GK0296 [Geobacillus kaustophilus HTA426]